MEQSWAGNFSQHPHSFWESTWRQAASCISMCTGDRIVSGNSVKFQMPFVFVFVEVLSLCVQEVQLAARARRREWRCWTVEQIQDGGFDPWNELCCLILHFWFDRPTDRQTALLMWIAMAYTWYEAEGITTLYISNHVVASKNKLRSNLHAWHLQH
jgi:hypothetical protein